jgi:hypothetical protein
MDRVRFETHRGKQVLIVDGTNCSPDELLEVFDEVQRVVTHEPKGSVLTLGDFTGAEFNKEAATRMKIVAAFDRPHVRRSALVGMDSFPDVFYKALLSFSARQFPTFKSKEEALEWLLEEEANRAAG